MALKSNPRTKVRDTGRELTAATLVDLNNRDDQRYTRSTVAHSKSMGARPWDWFTKIGEVHYGISRSARVAGYAQLQCVELDDRGRIVKEIDSGLEAELVASIASPYGGVRGLIDRFYTLMKVPGDSWLLELTDSDGDIEGYHFASADELDVTSFSAFRPGAGRLRLITLPATSGSPDGQRFVRELSPQNMLGRVWSPSRRYVDLPDSSLIALDSECEALHLLTETIKAKLKSRFALAGMFFIPDNVSTARIRGHSGQTGAQFTDDTLNYIVASMTRNVRNHGEASAYIPILLRGPGEAGKQIEHITVDREVFETDLALRAELIERIFQGLDVNQDTSKGSKEQSHWASWSASEDERRVAVQPDLETMCWALTRLILHRKLQAVDMPPEQILRRAVWFDMSKASVRANQQEDARQARDRGLISEEATRRMSGIEEKDQISEPERIRWIGHQVKNPMLMAYGLKEADKIDWDKVAKFPTKTGPAPNSPADTPEAGPGEGDPGSPDDRETDTPRRNRPA